VKNDNWRVWNRDDGYGELLFKRATGQLEEMESSKALCKVMTSFYQKGMTVADVGCGAGHYLRSLRTRLDVDIDYTGIDATDRYIALAKKAFPRNATFLSGDIFGLPFESESFDIVINNNVILHLPPPPKKAIEELIRIARKYVVIRTVFSERNYVIKEIRNTDALGTCELDGHAAADDEGNAKHFNYFNMYTKGYLRSVIHTIDPHVDIKIIDDDMWKTFDNRELTSQTGTKVIGDYQVSGSLLLDWKFIVITKCHNPLK
jgi:2-polyprenyl-3-methyl-5-hydroxy-6-metoxy-1,4-benzoquinol methylase